MGVDTLMGLFQIELIEGEGLGVESHLGVDEILVFCCVIRRGCFQCHSLD